MNSEAIAQLGNLEEKNISHLGITESELQKVVSGTTDSDNKPGIYERINTAVKNAKYFPHEKGIDMVLNVCDDILCEPLSNLSSSDKDFLLEALSKYTFLKRNVAEQENNDAIDIEEDEGATPKLI